MPPEIQTQLDLLSARIDKILKNPPMPDHFHNGFDSSRVNFADIYQKKIEFWHTIQGAAAATATNYGVFFIAPFNCTLLKFQESHQVIGSDAGAVTVTLEKLTGVQAPDAGVVMLTTALSLKATAYAVQTGTLTTTLPNRNLTGGDRLALKDAGTLTAVSNVTVYLELLVI